MYNETSFAREFQQNEYLNKLYEQRKKWFIHSLSSAIESVTSDQLVLQMFQTPSSKLFIPDRICEIIMHSIEDEREIFIEQLFQFISEKSSLFDLDELERAGSDLLNLSKMQMQIEIEQRNTIKQLSSTNDQNIINNKHNYKAILRKLSFLNTLVSTFAQEMRAFKRRIPIFLGKYKNSLNSYLNATLKYENSKLSESLLKLHSKYQKLKSEKIQNDKLYEGYLEQLKETQKKLENSKNQNIINLKQKIEVQTNEIESLKKQNKIYKEQIRQDQQKITQLSKIIQSNEEIISNRIQNLIISQKFIQKVKDEFEKVSFVLKEFKKIDFNQNKSEEIREKINFIKSKINSKDFESETIKELKEKCQQFMLTKEKVKQNLNENLSDSHFSELAALIEVCADFALQKELYEILIKLDEKIKVNSENDKTIKKLLKQLSKKTKENQRISIVNQKLQSQKDDLQQQIGDIRLQLRNNPSLSPLLTTSSRILFSPSKSQRNFAKSGIEINATPRAYTKSDIINFNDNTFTENDDNDNEGDDEGESELIDSEIFLEVNKI